MTEQLKNNREFKNKVSGHSLSHIELLEPQVPDR